MGHRRGADAGFEVAADRAGGVLASREIRNLARRSNASRFANVNAEHRCATVVNDIARILQRIATFVRDNGDRDRFSKQLALMEIKRRKRLFDKLWRIKSQDHIQRLFPSLPATVRIDAD